MRNVTPGILLLALVLGVAAACCTTLWMLNTSVTVAKRHAEIASLSPAQDPAAEWRSELRGLQEENADLKRRLEALEMPRPRSPRQAVGEFVTREEFDEFVAQLEVRLAKRDPLSQNTAELELHVAEALEAVREQQAEKQSEEFARKRAAGLEARVTKMSAWLSLDDYQQRELRALLSVQDAEEQEVIRLWKAGDTDPEILEEMKSSNHIRHVTALEVLLSPDQLQTYRERGRKDWSV